MSGLDVLDEVAGFAARHDGLTVLAWDLDGPLAPMTDRGRVLPYPDGTWPVDATIPASLRRAVLAANASAVTIALTGGSAQRGAALLATRQLWVWGSEGAGIFDPRLGRVRAAEGFQALEPVIAGIVAEMNAGLGELLATRDHPAERIVAEPKGTTTCSWHPAYLTDQAQAATGRDELIRLFLAAAAARGLTEQSYDPHRCLWTVTAADPGQTAARVELLVDPTNLSVTVRPFGVSKEFALPAAVETIEQVYGRPVVAVVFTGDGATDLHAVIGGRRLQRERAAAGRPLLFRALAAVTNRGLNAELADAADAVILGAGVDPRGPDAQAAGAAGMVTVEEFLVAVQQLPRRGQLAFETGEQRTPAGP